MCPAHKAKQLCKTCGKPVGNSLSVTQWISGADCQCAKLPSAVQDDLKAGSTQAENLCWRCGFPYRPGREGSLTQWIFRSNLCQCKNPILHRPGVPRSNVKGRYEKQRQTFDSLGIAPDSSPPAETLFEKRYALLEEINPDEDSFAVGARDIVLSKTVSIVRFNPVAEENAADFQSLVKRLSMLQHPALAPILHFGIDELNRPFFVADFVNQISLFEWLEQESRLPLDTAFDITMQLCDCLEYAHSKGVYHGDLNTDNVFISLEESKPQLRLVEFGYSAVHCLSEDAQSTNTRLAIDHAERNKDLMSVASLLFEMLSGSRPFQQAQAGQFWTTVRLDLQDLEHEDELNELLSRVFSSGKQSEKIDSIAEFKTTLQAVLASEQKVTIIRAQPAKTVHKPLSLSTAAWLLVSLAVAIPIAFSLHLVQNHAEENLVELPKPHFTTLFSSSSSSSKKVKSRARFLPKNEDVTRAYEEESERVSDSLSETPATLVYTGKKSLQRFYHDIALGSSCKEVMFVRTNMSNADVKQIAKLEPTSLWLTENGIDDESLRIISQIKGLQEIRMSQEKRITPTGLKSLKNLKSLWMLTLVDMNFDDQAMAVLKTFPALQQVNIERNRRITTRGLETLVQCKTIQQVAIGGCACAAIPDTKVATFEKEHKIKLYTIQLWQDSPTSVEDLTNDR